MRFETLTAYYIENTRTGKVLEVKNDLIEYGTHVILASKTGLNRQQWFIEPIEEQKVLIKNIQSSKVLAVSNNNQLIVAGELGDESVLWEMIMEDHHVQLTQNGLRLSIQDEKLLLKSDEGGSHDTWKIVQVDPSYAVPEPQPLDTGDYIVGAQMCNLWAGDGWKRIFPFQDRKPVIGWYKEATPIVTDWEIKMAVESGIRFFMPCWYRAKGNEGQPVEEKLSHWMRELKHAKYKDYIKYFLMWENLNKIACGIQDEDDLLQNVLPYLIEHYFKDSCYLKIENKPVLSVYGVQALIEQLGGEEKAKLAVEKMNQVCIDAGFDGLIFIGQFCWGDIHTDHFNMKQIGLDYSMSYHWPTFGVGSIPIEQDTFTDTEIISGHLTCWEAQEKGHVPNIINCSMGWDSEPWDFSSSRKQWRLSPSSFQALLDQAQSVLASRDNKSLDGCMVMLDNWNEFGEGHYMMPTEQYGFGYLDAIKRVFEKK